MTVKILPRYLKKKKLLESFHAFCYYVSEQAPFYITQIIFFLMKGYASYHHQRKGSYVLYFLVLPFLLLVLQARGGAQIGKRRRLVRPACLLIWYLLPCYLFSKEKLTSFHVSSIFEVNLFLLLLFLR